MRESKTAGIMLVIIGILIIAIWLSIFAFNLHEQWNNNVTFQSGHFGTFGDHFWAVGKTHMVLALIAGFLAIVPGIYYLCSSRNA